MFFCFFFTRVLFAHWTSFKGVWSKLIINKSAIAYCSTIKTISYRKRYSISFLAVAGMSTFKENFWRRENPIQQNKPCAEKVYIDNIDNTQTFPYQCFGGSISDRTGNESTAVIHSFDVVLNHQIKFFQKQRLFCLRWVLFDRFRRLKILCLCLLLLLFILLFELSDCGFFNFWKAFLKMAHCNSISMFRSIFPKGASSAHFLYFQAFWTVASCIVAKSTASSSFLFDTCPIIIIIIIIIIVIIDLF